MKQFNKHGEYIGSNLMLSTIEKSDRARHTGSFWLHTGLFIAIASGTILGVTTLLYWLMAKI